MALQEKALAVKAKRVERVREAVGPFLQPGEQVVVPAMAAGGINFWVAVLFLGPIGILLFRKNYLVALTDRRLIVINASGTERPKGLVFAHARGELTVLSLKHGAPFQTLRLALPDGGSFRLQFGKGKKSWDNGFDGEGRAISEALGGAPR